jgi:hypothetical protein
VSRVRQGSDVVLFTQNHALTCQRDCPQGRSGRGMGHACQKSAPSRRGRTGPVAGPKLPLLAMARHGDTKASASVPSGNPTPCRSHCKRIEEAQREDTPAWRKANCYQTEGQRLLRGTLCEGMRRQHWVATSTTHAGPSWVQGLTACFEQPVCDSLRARRYKGQGKGTTYAGCGLTSLRNSGTFAGDDKAPRPADASAEGRSLHSSLCGLKRSTLMKAGRQDKLPSRM